MKIWPFGRRTRHGEAVRYADTLRVVGRMAAEAIDEQMVAAGHAPADLTPFEMPANSVFTKTSTRFPPGQSGNPAGRRRGVGNDVLEARHIAAAVYRERFGGDTNDRISMLALKRAGQIMDGDCDERPEVQSVLAGIRRGRVLERRKVKGVGSITVEDVPTGRSDLCCVKVGFKRENGKGAAE